MAAILLSDECFQADLRVAERKELRALYVIGFTGDITRRAQLRCLTLSVVELIVCLVGTAAGNARSSPPIISQFHHPFRDKVDRSDRDGEDGRR